MTATITIVLLLLVSLPASPGKPPSPPRPQAEKPHLPPNYDVKCIGRCLRKAGSERMPVSEPVWIECLERCDMDGDRYEGGQKAPEKEKPTPVKPVG
jgi:hypothetical protein